MNKGVMTIYIAEDDADDRALVREAIAESGLDCKLSEFDNGSDLMDALHHSMSEGDGARSPVDLVMLDVHMPVKSGLQALREIKYHPHLKQIPVIMFTSDLKDEMVQSAYGVGANAYIQKTSILDDLVQFLKALNFMWGSPYSEQGTDSESVSVRDGKISLKPVTILMVEDDADSVEASSHLFERNCLVEQFLAVGNWEELEAYLGGKGVYGNRDEFPFPDLILLDLQLPGKSGIEIIDALKSDQAYRDIPIIAITGSEDPALIERARTAGAESVESKPICFSTLVDILRVIGGMYLSIVKRVPLPGRKPRAG